MSGYWYVTEDNSELLTEEGQARFYYFPSCGKKDRNSDACHYFQKNLNADFIVKGKKLPKEYKRMVKEGEGHLFGIDRDDSKKEYSVVLDDKFNIHIALLKGELSVYEDATGILNMRMRKLR